MSIGADEILRLQEIERWKMLQEMRVASSDEARAAFAQAPKAHVISLADRRAAQATLDNTPPVLERA